MQQEIEEILAKHGCLYMKDEQPYIDLIDDLIKLKPITEQVIENNNKNNVVNK